MELIIKELDELNIEDAGKCDGQFVIDCQLVLHVQNDQIHYELLDRPSTKKRYDPVGVDYAAYINNPEKIIYLAYVDGTVAGQVVLRKNWNNYAYIDDIAVDEHFRRLGIGQALIAQAKIWAREKLLPGIMLETQNNNVGAVKFYETCGFEIGGFDRYLYKGLEAHTEEVALYWYFFFDR